MSLTTWQLPHRWRPALAQVAWLVVGGDRAHEETRRAWAQTRFANSVPGAGMDAQVEDIPLRDLGMQSEAVAMGWRAVVRRRQAWEALKREAMHDSLDERGLLHILLHVHAGGGAAVAFQGGIELGAHKLTGSPGDFHLGSRKAIIARGRDFFGSIGGRELAKMISQEAVAQHTMRQLRRGLEEVEVKGSASKPRL